MTSDGVASKPSGNKTKSGASRPPEKKHPLAWRAGPTHTIADRRLMIADLNPARRGQRRNTNTTQREISFDRVPAGCRVRNTGTKREAGFQGLVVKPAVGFVDVTGLLDGLVQQSRPGNHRFLSLLSSRLVGTPVVPCWPHLVSPSRAKACPEPLATFPKWKELGRHVKKQEEVVLGLHRASALPASDSVSGRRLAFAGHLYSSVRGYLLRNNSLARNTFSLDSR